MKLAFFVSDSKDQRFLMTRIGLLLFWFSTITVVTPGTVYRHVKYNYIFNDHNLMYGILTGSIVTLFLIPLNVEKSQ